eukprot:g1099.t1
MDHANACCMDTVPVDCYCTSDVTTVTIVGSGNSAHVCASLFHQNTQGRVRTQLLTSTPEVWSGTPTVTFPHSVVQQQGKIHRKSSDPAEVIPNADIVLWTGPVHCTKEVFEKIQPHLDVRKTVVGTIFGQGLVHVSAARVFGDGVKFFALRNIPWLCRLVEKGRSCEIVGPKARIEVALLNFGGEEEKASFAEKSLFPLFHCGIGTGTFEPVVDVLPDFTPIVFNPANQIIHPAAYWGHFRQYDFTETGVPNVGEYLYRGMSETAGEVLQQLDQELQNIKTAYADATGGRAAAGATGCALVKPLRQRLLEQYGSQIADKGSMAKMGNKRPNAAHRVVQDDIGWGLCVLLSVAENLERKARKTIPTTFMRAMVEWHQEVMGKEFLVNGRLVGKDCGGIVLLDADDDLELVAGVGGGGGGGGSSVEGRKKRGESPGAGSSGGGNLGQRGNRQRKGSRAPGRTERYDMPVAGV